VKVILLLFLIANALIGVAQTEGKISKPGIREVQIPFNSLKPLTAIKIGGTADWVLVTENAVWVASTKPYALIRIDPATNDIVAKVAIPGEACSGLTYGFGSIWVPLCGKKPALVRIDTATNKISATLKIHSAGPEGGVEASEDSVWLVSDKNGTLNRINPATNSVRQQITIPAGSYNLIFCGGAVWISGFESSVLTAVDATKGRVIESVSVGPKPRFLTCGSGSVWTLNQGDGTISRVDEKTRKLVATIPLGIPGFGGDIAYGAESVWTSVFSVPLTRINSTSNHVMKQWIGEGGDSLRVGFGSIWVTDYKKGLLLRLSTP
jgi:streptogramin lyase